VINFIDRKRNLILALTILVGLGLRVVAALVVGSSRLPYELEFEEIARNLVQHGTYSYSFYGLSPNQLSSFIPPVYPLFLASADLLWPANGDWLVKAIQILFSGATILGLYSLARELGGSTKQGLLVAFFWAIYPPAIAYASDLSTVTLEIFFFIAGIWLLLRGIKRHSAWLVLPAGVLLTLAALTRSTWLIVLPLAIIWLIWYLRRNRQAWIKLTLVFFVGAAATLTPWVVHNYQTQGRWLLTSTNGGLNFWIGNNAHATGEYIFPTAIDEKLVLSVAGWPEINRDHFFYTQGFTFIRNSPLDFLALLGRKLLYSIFFRPNIGSTYEAARISFYNLSVISFVAAWLALLPFALIGLFHLGSHWREHCLLILAFIGNLATSTLYFSGTRFRTPVDGFAMIWAAIGLTFLYNKWQERKSIRARISDQAG
jgi:4-amino-4-deoxy-L-arabinose transferase-like glycosyltransferase